MEWDPLEHLRNSCTDRLHHVMSDSLSTKGRLKNKVTVPGTIKWVGQIITAYFYKFQA
jgi:hypothetical protein